LRRYLGNGNGVQDIWLARTPTDAGMRLFGKMIGTLYHFDLLAVIARQIAVKHFAKRILYHAFLFCQGGIFFIAHQIFSVNFSCVSSYLANKTTKLKITF
jgi:hypothetical protein